MTYMKYEIAGCVYQCKIADHQEHLAFLGACEDCVETYNTSLTSAAGHVNPIVNISV